ncbi:MAG: bifunctional biotin--[acetyl-CoA-carboxylase] synthetase/biotin operon repressor [Oceanospirillaceae bacterium]|jgi:BirA family biotin operon repressor/biotin-[acetyl-CoA-carboxylase] ligase|nr:bifunctional biotin--[acetyl-CoA-carboxylase] synthetase/biotin operon repressor [Oceanospirillaceae bacterium]
MTMERLLDLLSDGSFHSGRALGEALGVSRSAVWKQMQRLQELGVEIYSVKGRGYRVPGGLDLLDQAHFTALLSEPARERLAEIAFAPEVASTNEVALSALGRGVRSGLYAAEYQSQGRGRRGRSWLSPYGSNLYFSLAWRFSAGVAGLEGLSLAVGLAIKDALARSGVHDIKLKWPNDLLWEGCKLGGVLIELSGDASGECEVVIGVGLNVRLGHDQKQVIDQPATDLLRLMGQAPARNELLALLVDELVAMIIRFENAGFSSLRERWQAANAHHDKAVRLIAGAHEVRGICRGVDDSGALLVETDTGIQAFHGGEISVRAQE